MQRISHCYDRYGLGQFFEMQIGTPREQEKFYLRISWINCFGNFTLSNGDKFVGEFKSCGHHGNEKLTYADGRIEKGIWDYGLLNNIKKFQKYLKEI